MLFSNIRLLDRTQFEPLMLLPSEGPILPVLDELNVDYTIWGREHEPQRRDPIPTRRAGRDPILPAEAGGLAAHQPRQLLASRRVGRGESSENSDCHSLSRRRTSAGAIREAFNDDRRGFELRCRPFEPCQYPEGRHPQFCERRTVRSTRSTSGRTWDFSRMMSS